MSAPVDLTGRWSGYYEQHGRRYPIAAELAQDGLLLTGTMRDGQPESTASLFELAAEQGLPPGADERLAEALRRAVPPGTSGPIRYVTRLPRESSLEGRLDGHQVRLVKRYRGTASGGFLVGDVFLGLEHPGHAVCYEGCLTPDGTTIEGRWVIPPESANGPPRGEGFFHLRREAAGNEVAEEA